MPIRQLAARHGRHVAQILVVAVGGQLHHRRRIDRVARVATVSGRMEAEQRTRVTAAEHAVGTAAESGWGYIPIYLGPMAVIFFGWGMIQRIITVSKRQNLTSIADFIAARYGKARSLAVLVTVLATIGSIPYIALQLKALPLFENLTTRQLMDLAAVVTEETFELHPVLQDSVDTVVQGATHDASGFFVPARTTAVFVQEQDGAACDDTGGGDTVTVRLTGLDYEGDTVVDYEYTVSTR